MSEDKFQLVLELLKQQAETLQSIKWMLASIGIAILWQWIRGGDKK